MIFFNIFELNVVKANRLNSRSSEKFCYKKRLYFARYWFSKVYGFSRIFGIIYDRFKIENGITDMGPIVNLMWHTATWHATSETTSQ